jgi:hypothetical protein
MRVLPNAIQQATKKTLFFSVFQIVQSVNSDCEEVYRHNTLRCTHYDPLIIKHVTFIIMIILNTLPNAQ